MPRAKGLRLHLTRDSVAMADDMDAPHLKKVTLPADVTAEGIATWIVENRYLPQNVQGGKATWSLVSKRPIAVLAQQWDRPKMLSNCPDSLEDLDFEDGVLRAQVNYHAQKNPNAVFRKLDRQSRGGILSLLVRAAGAKQTD